MNEEAVWFEAYVDALRDATAKQTAEVNKLRSELKIAIDRAEAAEAREQTTKKWLDEKTVEQNKAEALYEKTITERNNALDALDPLTLRNAQLLASVDTLKKDFEATSKMVKEQAAQFKAQIEALTARVEAQPLPKASLQDIRSLPVGSRIRYYLTPDGHYSKYITDKPQEGTIIATDHPSGNATIGWKAGEPVPRFAHYEVSKTQFRNVAAGYGDFAKVHTVGATFQCELIQRVVEGDLKDTKIGDTIGVYLDAKGALSRKKTDRIINAMMVAKPKADSCYTYWIATLAWKSDQTHPSNANPFCPTVNGAWEHIPNEADYAFGLSVTGDAGAFECLIPSKPTYTETDVAGVRERCLAAEKERDTLKKQVDELNSAASMGLRVGDRVHITQWNYSKADFTATILATRGAISSWAVGWKPGEIAPTSCVSIDDKARAGGLPDIDAYDRQHILAAFSDTWEIIPPEPKQAEENPVLEKTKAEASKASTAAATVAPDAEAEHTADVKPDTKEQEQEDSILGTVAMFGGALAGSILGKLATSKKPISTDEIVRLVEPAEQVSDAVAEAITTAAIEATV